MVEPIEIKKGQDFVKSVACYCWCCLFFSFFHGKDVKGICKREGIRRIGGYIVFYIWWIDLGRRERRGYFIGGE